ncbi:putative odorant receptor 45a [Lucilia cuprina]|uniref:Putative odorant receptor 45a n=1 Tax=Lucilia cuprina TaxID=7375 RepID=A0A0L0BPF8_LUCCU|nr:putative odorant receptor 45a [Lucilia cuprina]
MVVKGYFYVQKLCFIICGVDTEASKSERIIKHPLLFYVPLFFAITHVMAIVHYAFVNRHDYVEVTDSLALSCQSLLAIFKMIIFVLKRENIINMIREVHSGNLRAGTEELPLIRLENFKDVTFCTIYFRVVLLAAITAFLSPILEAIYFYVTTEELILRVPYKARPEHVLKRPLFCYVPLFFAITHFLAIIHYAFVNRNDYVEVTDSLALSCQTLLAIWKMIIFLIKRRQFVSIIQKVHSGNLKVKRLELPIICSENLKDVKFSTTYFVSVAITGVFGFANPVIEAIYFYFTTGELILRVPYKATIYNLFGITLAIDTLFTWLVSNISAQFHILCFRFKNTADIYKSSATAATTTASAKASREGDSLKFLKNIKSCIQFHSQTLELTEKLNQVYGEIIFIKFIISCSEICCLVFRLSRPSESMAAAAYQFLFLVTVAMQLILYCYNGQRIRDESLQVAPEIYFAFDWTHLPKSCKKLLLLPMMRSQKSSQLKAVLFIVDLSLYLWVMATSQLLVTFASKMTFKCENN